MKVRTTITITAEYEPNPESYPGMSEEEMIQEDRDSYGEDPMLLVNNYEQATINVKVEKI